MLKSIQCICLTLADYKTFYWESNMLMYKCTSGSDCGV